ncbi:hypothetical protein KR018_003794 [Drosophila ironensis]|nr:hypothetical protein KR018_003794 [Drosophila ironensis]
MPTALNPLVLCICCLPLIISTIEARSRPSDDRPIVFPKDDNAPHSHSSIMDVKTTTEASATTLATNATSSEEEMAETTTGLPIVVNRILFESTKKCKEGYELRAQRCRKAA